jgi:hypothetical protein
MSRPLHLDFVDQRTGVSRAGILVLALGLVAGGIAVAEFRDVRAQTASLEERIADFRRLGRREQAPIRVGPTDGKALAQEIRSANAVLAQLNLPWDALFRELEAAATDGVTLLAIQPDVASGQVRIGGEAKSYESALAYVSKLEASERFANVFLVSHEVRATAPRRPVAFSLVAEWMPRS